MLYQRWLTDGDAVFESASSSAIEQALVRGTGRIESHVLLCSYDHLSPVVDSVGPATRGAEKGAEKPDQRGEQTPARPRPPFSQSNVNAISSSSADSAAAEVSATS